MSDQPRKTGFRRHGFVGVRNWVPRRLVTALNAAADRPNSQARQRAQVISGGTLQLSMSNFSQTEKVAVEELCASLLSSKPVLRAAAALWPGVRLRTSASYVLEGGTEQLPHADSLYPNALIACVSLRDGQMPTKVHVEGSGRTSLSLVQPGSGRGSDNDGGDDDHDDDDDEAEREALESISIVSRPLDLNMMPTLDTPMERGDGVLMVTSVVHAGPGGLAQDGSPRRVAFVSIEPSAGHQLPAPYDSKYQFHALQHMHSTHTLNEKAQHREQEQVEQVLDQVLDEVEEQLKGEQQQVEEDEQPPPEEDDRRLRRRTSAQPQEMTRPARKRPQSLEPFFTQVRAESGAWRERGHELSHFMFPSVRAKYEKWLESQEASEAAAEVEVAATAQKATVGTDAAEADGSEVDAVAAENAAAQPTAATATSEEGEMLAGEGDQSGASSAPQQTCEGVDCS